MSDSDLESLSDRLRRLEDLEEIRQLCIDYGAYLDGGDFASYAELFAAHGEVLLGPLGRARGPAAIRRLLEARLTGQQGLAYHLIANPQVRLDGDRATSIVAWAVLARDSGHGGPILTLLGHHRDVLIREHGRWRFLRREGHLDLPSKLPSGA